MNGTQWFSLIVVCAQAGNMVDGNWVQDHRGTLATAAGMARHTEAVNGNKITVAVVPQINSTVPMMEYWQNMKRLDV